MKIPQSRETSDYQSDIYEARVKIAETRWESGYIPKRHRKIKEPQTDRE